MKILVADDSKTGLAIISASLNNLGHDVLGVANGEQAKSMIALANILKLKLIAEGIETKEQLQFLAKSKCHYGEGFYLSQPLTSDQMGLLLQRENAHGI